MKTTKKLLALLLAAMMVVALSIAAFADGEAYAITVTNTNGANVSIAGKEFSAYKVFDVTYDVVDKEGTAGNAYSYTLAPAFEKLSITVGDKSYYGEDLITYLGTLTDNSDALNDFAAQVFSFIEKNGVTAAGKATGVKSGDSETAVISLAEAGYYLVGGTVTSASGEEVVAACGLTTTNPKANVKVKADAPNVDKIIVNGDAESDKGTAVNVGDTVPFQVTSRVPDMTGYTSYTYYMTDTLSAGLTPVDANNDGMIDVTVTIGGENYTGFTVEKGAENGQFKVIFNNMIEQKANAGKEVVISYAAVLNSGATKSQVETNTVNLTYSNNPYDDSKHETTPDHEVYVYDFDIVIDKYAKDDTETTTDNKRLSGAKFVLYRTVEGAKQYYKRDSDYAVTWVTLKDDEVEAAVKAGTITQETTDSRGVARFYGVDAGTYNLHETEAPKGYNKLTEDPTVTISVTYNEYGQMTSSTAQSNGDQYEQKKEVENSTGTILPSTGGIGTTIFYVIGGILMVVAAALLITKKKMSAEE